MGIVSILWTPIAFLWTALWWCVKKSLWVLVPLLLVTVVGALSDVWRKKADKSKGGKVRGGGHARGCHA